MGFIELKKIRMFFLLNGCFFSEYLIFLQFDFASLELAFEVWG
jgi:hypothetical protein